MHLEHQKLSKSKRPSQKRVVETVSYARVCKVAYEDVEVISVPIRFNSLPKISNVKGVERIYNSQFK